MMQRVGSCSICGGNVMGIRGAWYSVSPPPPDHCANCGATSVADVIPMHAKLKPPDDTVLWPDGYKPDAHGGMAF